MNQGHASAVFDANRVGKTDFKNLSLEHIHGIKCLILESQILHDEQDPDCMPHRFQARLGRWEYLTNQVAKKLNDPYSALLYACTAITDWGRQCNCLDKDWNQRVSKSTGQTFLTYNMEYFEAAGSTNPRDAALKAIEAQKSYAILARAKAIDVFTTLAKTYKAEAIVALDDSASKLEKASKYLGGLFDPDSVRTMLAQEICSEDLAKVKKPEPVPKAP